MPYVRRTNEIATTPAEAGRIGMRQRWGAPHRLIIRDLDETTRQRLADQVELLRSVSRKQVEST